MVAVLLFASLLYFCFLLWEAYTLRAARRRLSHVVHVNGTRGKSTVSRLIEAGLRAGGLRVFCKTTGADPMTIDVDGREEAIRRRGKANIKEQIGILRRTVAQGAQVLVVECMALQPELQRTAQHDILRADIGVITNVRRDHTDVMGETLAQIADALGNTVPRGGVLFTAEERCAPRLAARAEQNGSRFVRAQVRRDEGDFDFPENIALALAVCEELGVPRDTALAGMRRFPRDPYALSLYRFGAAVFINGLSINDVQSICMVWDELCAQHGWSNDRLMLLINNRVDRGSRTQDMLRACAALCPAEVWLMGASRGYMRRRLAHILPHTPVRRCAGTRATSTFPRISPVRSLTDVSALSPAALTAGQVIFAIGNIAGDGRALIERVRKEGSRLV